MTRTNRRAIQRRTSGRAYQARKARWLQRLREAGEANGNVIPQWQKREAARELSRCVRTIERWLDGDVKPRPKFELNDDHLVRLRLYKGNVRAAHKELSKEGLIERSYETMLAAFNALPAWERDGIRGGVERMRRSQPYLSLAEPEARNVIWEIDHGLLSGLDIYDPVARKKGHAWVTVCIDVATRVVVGFAVTVGEGRAANTESAFAAIADGMLGRRYGDVFVGGKPDTIRFDQGKDFMHGVADALLALGITPDPVEAMSPWLKPHVERVIRTLKARILTLPGANRDQKKKAA